MGVLGERIRQTAGPLRCHPSCRSAVLGLWSERQLACPLRGRSTRVTPRREPRERQPGAWSIDCPKRASAFGGLGGEVLLF